MEYSQPITDLIKHRFSCRVYKGVPIEVEKIQKLRKYLSTLHTGPLGTKTHFELTAATEDNLNALKKMGTYGFIKGATGFIIGTMCAGEKNLEDFGYQMEKAILFATELQLGTCWLGGTFTKRKFTKKIITSKSETVPAVAATGNIADGAYDAELRYKIGALQRLPWEKMFFDGQFNTPLSSETAEKFAEPLEMVRLGPSASNKQPWRIIKDNTIWHFYLQRTPGYPPFLIKHLMGIADIQRMDIGIAMCHFELTARSLRMKGEWVIKNPQTISPDDFVEYVVSWQEL